MLQHSTRSVYARRIGWRWAFIVQMFIFFLSFVVASYHLRYPTPVSSAWGFFSSVLSFIQASLAYRKRRERDVETDRLLRHSSAARFRKKFGRQHLIAWLSACMQVLSFLIFLSNHFSEQIPVSASIRFYLVVNGHLNTVSGRRSKFSFLFLSRSSSPLPSYWSTSTLHAIRS